MTNKEDRAFRVDARALLSLGRESIKDHTTALVELVKNSYDADAEHVEVEIVADQSPPYIRIADDGDGMDSADINGKWLRIGFSEKRKRKISEKGRRETGEKGIGRLSADRLGAALQLKSRKESSAPVGIQVNWNEFDVEGKEIGAVKIHDIPQPKPVLPAASKTMAHGTEIIITELRQTWTRDDLAALETELSTLVPPSLANNDFAIWLRVGAGDSPRRVASSFEGIAELEFQGSFDSTGRLSYEITARPISAGQKRRSIRSGKVPWNQHVPSSITYDLGRFSISLSFFLRGGIDLGNFTLGQLKEYLDTYGGVRIYRDNIRVKPYGDPLHADGDWLGLSERKVRNPAGAGRRDFRISANQLVGVVSIGRDSNPKLTDSAAREGLVHGDAYSSLRSAVFGCVELLETTYHERFSERKNEKDSLQKIILPNVVGEIRNDLVEVTKNLSRVERDDMTAGSSRLLSDTVVRLEAVAAKVALAGREIDDLANQTTVYRGLATVGISSAVFGHETESALAQAKISTSLAFKAVDRELPKIELCKTELIKATAAIERVQVWGQFALARVKKDKRRRVRLDLSKVVGAVVNEMEPLFGASSISLAQKIQPDLTLRAFAMDIEALVLNLLTNAYHAASLAKKNRRVVVRLESLGKGDERQVRIAVEDSGPGITKEHVRQIWTPLFSTKVDGRGRPIGTGLGLTIVKSVADDLGGSVLATPKGALGGATVEVTFPVKG